MVILVTDNRVLAHDQTPATFTAKTNWLKGDLLSISIMPEILLQFPPAADRDVSQVNVHHRFVEIRGS